MDTSTLEPRIQQLKREDRLLEALALCEQWMADTEKRAEMYDQTVESWPYWQACVILRKLKRPADEVAVIERLLHQPYSASKQARDVIERLSKAYQLAGVAEIRTVDGQPVMFYVPEGVPVDERPMFVGDAVIVDCETTGLAADDELIELAVIRFRYSHLSGRILGEVGRYCGLREPACPISAAASKVHGLSMSDVAGQRLDVHCVRELINGVKLAVAHNAAFDKRMVTPLLPELNDIPWFCSLRSIDWQDKGCASSKLEDIAKFYGATKVAHRSMADAQLVFDVLSQIDGSTDHSLFHELIADTPLGYISRWKSLHQDDDEIDDDEDGEEYESSVFVLELSLPDSWDAPRQPAPQRTTMPKWEEEPRRGSQIASVWANQPAQPETKRPWWRFW